MASTLPPKSRLDAPVRYFDRVYPLLRGARGGVPFTNHLTEPGVSERLDWVLGEMNGAEHEAVLDAGCGLGLYSIALARRGHHVTAVDVSETMLESTRRAAVAAGVADRIELVRADLRTWKPARPFSTVLSLGVAEYYADAASFLERQFSWAQRRLLVTWSASGVGPRAILRHAWLALNGLSARLVEAKELTRMLDRPDCEIRLDRTYWTHCAVVQRRTPSVGEHANGHAHRMRS